MQSILCRDYTKWRRPQNYMGEITVGTQPLKLHVWKVKRCHTPTLTSLQRETNKPSHSCMYLKGKFHTTLTFLQNARMLRLVCGTFNEHHWRCHTHNLNILAVFCLFLSQIDRFTLTKGDLDKYDMYPTRKS